jgi:hypothetical protein
MNGEQIERMAQALAARQNRRGLARTLGALLLTGAGVVSLAGNDATARRRKRRNQKQKSNRCQPGDVLQRLRVPGEGSTVETKHLKEGDRYRLRVTGYIEDEEWGLDGEYYFIRDEPDDLAQVYDACFDGTPVGLAVTGATVSHWGDYDETHEYERKVTGQGQPLSLRVSDCRYDENSGYLTVELLCG